MAVADHVQQFPAPPGLPRVETGAVQFGDDWPGLFIRGDDTNCLMLCVRRLADILVNHPNADVANAVRQLGELADMIDQDVSERHRVRSIRPG